MPEWMVFKCRMPRDAYVVLEEALEKARLLAGIDEELPIEVQDGLAAECLAIEFLNVPEESVV